MKFTPFLMLWIFVSAQSLLAETITLKDNILPRGIENNSTFTVDIHIEDITPPNYKEDFDFEKSVGLGVKQADSSRELAKADIGEDDINDIGLVIESRSEKDRGLADSGNYYVVITVTVREDGKTIASLLQEENGKKYLDMRGFYTSAQNEDFSSEFLQISESLQVANAAPGNFEVSGAFKALRFTWNAGETIEFRTGLEAGDVKSATPTDSVVVVFDESANLLDLPTYKFLPDADADEAGTLCHIDYSKVDTEESCVVCDDNGGNDKVYLNYNGLAQLSELTVSKIGTGGGATAKGFEPNKTYAAFMYYIPDGLVRSACKTAQPTLNLTWSEFSGEAQASESDPKCFVATAAYGSPLDQRVETLRWFRDRYLMTSELGSNFVALYYATAPILVPYISQNPVLKKLVQTVLYPVVVFSEYSQNYGFTKTLIFSILILGAFLASIRLFWLRIWGTL